jgi:protein-S-isoprenylcysteine O-methyltransferase Ste14
VGALLFRRRLLVIVGFFLAAMMIAVVLHGATALPRVLVPSGSLLAREALFLVTGPLCLLAFFLRASGEARLGSAVYGQDAPPRIITAGPFRHMRHPLYAGTFLFFIAAAAPYLPLSLLLPLGGLFAAALRAIATYEERSLAAAHGEAWARYAAAVPQLLPWKSLGRREALAAEADDVVSLRAWGAAALSNLGLLSLGLYRVLVGLELSFVGLGVLNLACLTLWVGVVVVRRLRQR